jgi:hypothetical protein
VRLIDLKLRALPFAVGQHDYTDDAVRGLSVRVGSAARLSWNSRRRIKVGQYPT